MFLKNIYLLNPIDGLFHKDVIIKPFILYIKLTAYPSTPCFKAIPSNTKAGQYK